VSQSLKHAVVKLCRHLNARVTSGAEGMAGISAQGPKGQLYLLRPGPYLAGGKGGVIWEKYVLTLLRLVIEVVASLQPLPPAPRPERAAVSTLNPKSL